MPKCVNHVSEHLSPMCPVHTPTGSGCFPASTNGLASGNHILEAFCHGLAEVIERDATALWNRLDGAGRGRTRIDIETVEDDDCTLVIENLLRAGLDVAVWETTSDVGVPSFYCLLTDDRPNAHLGEGAGCHPVRAVALARALTEAVQVRTTYITGARDDLPPDQYTERGRVQKLRQAAALMRPGEPGRRFDDGPDLRNDTFRQDLDWMLERLSACGIDQVVLVDLTREDFGIPVARVVVPGLEAPHDDEGYLPGPRALAAGRNGR